MSCSLSTHVLDTGAGSPPRAFRSSSARRRPGCLGRDGRRRPRAARGRLGARHVRARLDAAVAVLPPGRADGRARGRPLPRPAPRLAYGSPSYRGVSRVEMVFPRRLSARRAGRAVRGAHRVRRAPRARARPARPRSTLVHELPDDEKREVLNAHPAIGQRKGLSARSASEQGADLDPEVIAELLRLNADYEDRHGFRFWCS